MKRIITLILSILIMIVCFASCGKENRILFNTDLDKYVTLGDYKGLEVDTASDEYKSYYDTEIENDIVNNYLYEDKAEGTVEEKDIANINYVGKKDGVAFDGGTADNYDLTIGSNTFISGFEEGLIGVNKGETVELNLTFPKNYQKTELAGKDVVFTVKVNSIKTPSDPENYYEKLAFNSVEDYYADVKVRAAENYLKNMVISNSKVKDYPEEDIETLVNSMIKYYDSLSQSQYGVDFSTILATNNDTIDQFKEQIKTSTIKPLMDIQMPLYAILDKEKLSIEAIEYDGDIDYNLAISESAGVEEAVKKFLYEEAKIK